MRWLPSGSPVLAYNVDLWISFLYCRIPACNMKRFPQVNFLNFKTCSADFHSSSAGYLQGNIGCYFLGINEDALWRNNPQGILPKALLLNFSVLDGDGGTFLDSPAFTL